MNTLRLAIDVESGDYGSRVILAGLLEARTLCNFSFQAFLCGNKERIEKVIKDYNAHDKLGDYQLVECNDIIDPGEKRANVWKNQANASIIRCITLQKEHIVDASVSAGDTAILLGAALFILGRTEGISRPALAAFLPTIKNKPVLLLDVGANLNCRPEHLASFAIVGNSYVRQFLDIPSPEVALLSIGKEAIKGTRILSETEALLKKSAINYCGFIEGNDIIAGKADVVVCDGFCGNVLLKTFESFHTLARSVLGDDISINNTIKKNICVLDPEKYGAVPFLGIKGTVFKAHGGSSSHAIAHALLAAITAINRNALRDTTALNSNRRGELLG